VISSRDIVRLHLGYFTVPTDVDDHRAGEQVVVVAYLIRHPAGLVLFDTGIGQDDEVDRVYRPVRRDIRTALEAAGVEPSDVRVVANCHLHVDHGGGNRLFPDRPIFAQTIEYRAAHEPEYTIQEVVDFHGAAFELLEGEAEVLPGIRVIPTPGHVPGHQSLVVETKEGRIVLAGQALNEASHFARARFAWELETTGVGGNAPYPQWIRRLQEYDPVRVLFAHDLAVWERDPIGNEGRS
jgi:N-acyl homoserine lactone hydrolase